MRRLLLLAILTPACVREPVIGSGEVITESRDVAAFDGLRNSSPIRVEVDLREGSQDLSVRCDDNLLVYIETVVRDGELRVSVDDVTFIDVSPRCAVLVSASSLSTIAGEGSGAIETDGPLQGLRRLSNSGSGSVLARSITSTDDVAVILDGSGALTTGVETDGTLRLSNDGSGRLQVDRAAAANLDAHNMGSGATQVIAIDAGDVQASTEGSGALELFGTADTVDLTVDGSGALDGRDLVSAVGQVLNGASGRLDVHATSSVEGSLRGSGSIHVHGRPAQIDIEDDGSGQVVVE